MSRLRVSAGLAVVALTGACITKSYTFDWSPDAADAVAIDASRDASLVDAPDVAMTDATDAGPDAHADEAPREAGPDGGLDAGGDSADAPAGDAPDTLPSADDGIDAARETSVEAGADVAAETSADAARGDALALDAGPDAADANSGDTADAAAPFDAFDASADAALDATPEAMPDAGPDASDATSADGTNADASDATSADAGCPAGTVLGAAGCEVPAPVVRRLSPLSGATVATGRPELRWQPPPGGEALQIRLCADRFCTNSLRREAVSGGSYVPPEALARGVYFWRLEPASSGPLPASYATTWQFSVTHFGTAPSTISWGALSDFDGDGLADVVTGDPAANGGQGAAYVSRGLRGATVRYEAPVAIARPSGAPSGFGSAFASGDVNGDGYVDLLIGAPGSGALEGGAVYLRFGGPVARPIERLTGLGAGDGFGTSLDAAGDVNGDGYADVAIGAPRFNEARGVVAVMLGTATTPGPTFSVHPPSGGMDFWLPGAGYGAAVAFAGDADGDRRDELFVGAPCAMVSSASPFAGKGYFAVHISAPVVGGGVLGVVTGESFMFPVNTRLGASLVRGGDIDADGLPEMLIGAPGYDIALVVSALGRSPAYDFSAVPFLGSPGAGVGLATSLGGGNDLNGDGFDEPILGAPAANPTGLMLVYIGGALPLATFQQLPPPRAPFSIASAGARFGASISIVGDSNGDNLSELLVGAPAESGGGAVFYQYGRAGIFDGNWEFARMSAPTTPTTQFGAALAR